MDLIHQIQSLPLPTPTTLLLPDGKLQITIDKSTYDLVCAMKQKCRDIDNLILLLQLKHHHSAGGGQTVHISHYLNTTTITFDKPPSIDRD